MKKIAASCFATALLSLVSCRNATTNGSDAGHVPLPKPGATITSIEVPVKDDPLNHFTCSIKVIADSDIAHGMYDVDADFGPNFAEGQFTMPKGGETFKPVIRKGPVPYTFIIGFKMPADTIFYEYYQVSCAKDQIKMQYIKAYTF